VTGAEPVLRFSHVTKTFAHHAGRKLLRERLADLVRPGRNARYTALDDVSFEMAHGESLGLIGANGAGKSTILNLATGVALPDSGSIQLHGRVAAMLELGAGFHYDLTGAENLLINAALMGLSRRETAERFEQIIEFSGVRAFIDEPLRTYSAGMTVRLAFAVAVHTDPDVLVIDEVIGMGDQQFYARCLEKIHAFQRGGKTILLASHSLDLVTMLCQRALWLDHGRVVEIGPVAQVAAAYRAGRVTGA
jgi:ABC-type polysaccharide/polyol phosphate transport system ATPase subunit